MAGTVLGYIYFVLNNIYFTYVSSVLYLDDSQTLMSVFDIAEFSQLSSPSSVHDQI